MLLILALLLGGCQAGAQQPSPRRMADLSRDEVNTARLSLFLTLSETDGPGVRITISAIEIFADGVWLPVSGEPLELDAEKIGSTQLFLGGRAVPPGHYQRLRFTVEKGSVRRDSGRYDTVSPASFPLELNLPSPLVLEEDDSRSLFLTWDVQATLERTGDFRPVMTVAPQIKQLLADLVYAACPEIDTVFVVRSDKNWVADSFGIHGRPTYLAMDPDISRRRLYVLASREAAIKVVDLSSQRIIDTFHLTSTEAPTFMTISPDGKWAYILEEKASYLSRFELGTGIMAARVRLGHRPQYAAYLPDRNLLAVSSGLSQSVSLLHPLELTVAGTILTGDTPQGLLALNDLLYIAESGDHTVSIFDLATNRSLSRLEVGFGPRRLLRTENFIYVANYDGGSLSVLLPGQLGVIREVNGLGRPLEMIFEQVRHQLYVGDEQEAGLAVIDSTSNQIIGRINLGAQPLGLALIDRMAGE